MRGVLFLVVISIAGKEQMVQTKTKAGAGPGPTPGDEWNTIGTSSASPFRKTLYVDPLVLQLSESESHLSAVRDEH